jgi:hypothetical protein
MAEIVVPSTSRHQFSHVKACNQSVTTCRIKYKIYPTYEADLAYNMAHVSVSILHYSKVE